MRNAWKSLFVRSLSRISAQIPRFESPNLQVRPLEPLTPSFSPSFLIQNAIRNPRFRYFSSEPSAIERKDQDDVLVAEIFSKPIGSDEIKAELDSLNLSLDQQTVNLVLQNLESRPETASRFFDWVSERESKLLRSKSYNIMLGILGKKGHSEEFWGLVEMMKGKGFGITKDAFLKVSESFHTGKMEKDLNMLKEIYFLNSSQNVVPRMCPRVCKVLREEEESSEIQKKLQDLGLSLSSELVFAVLERTSSYPKKALMFLRGVEENPSFKIDGRIYNAMATVLGREDCIEEFWDVLHKMRNAGYEMEMETYVKVSGRFYKRKMISAVVDLYELAMAGSEKPPLRDFLFLLKKIVVSKDLDMSLLSRVVSIFTNAGNSIKGSTFDRILKSLRSVGRLGECDKILKAMEGGGFVADSDVHDGVVVGLCNAGRLDEALEYIYDLEKLGRNPDSKIWTSLVQKYSLIGELDRALSCFRKMVEKKGGEKVGCAFEVLVNRLCQKNRADDAFKILKEMVTKKDLQPWHSTYKFLIERLISQGSLKEASSLLGLMKGNGFPPFIDPFIGYISKSGTADDAMGFLKAMTVKEFPSTAVFVRVFETLLKAGRHEVAHDILSQSPGCVRNHVDVLDLLYSMKPNEAAIAAAT